ncbi:MAG: LacI family DNA-binding transcriptional regulator [Candidatus Omnitrophota bacterium]
MSNKKRKISINDVASHAGVSITTVSRVINKVTTVNSNNKAKVEKAIAELHYEPDANAQRLARGTTNAIGFVIPGYPGIFYSFYAIELIRGVGHACEELNQDLIFHITNGFNDLNTGNVGGIVFADIIENRRQVESAIKVGIPCMVINNIVDDLEVNYIGIDNYRGGWLAAEYLTGLNHQNIATITGTLKTQAGKQRLEGFRDYLEKHHQGLHAAYIIEGDYSRRSARDGMEKLLSLEHKEPPTAVFVASDDMALEAVAVINEKGLKVPEDISVIGFDDNPSALYGQVALTTIHQPLFQMAEQAVKRLHLIIQGKSGELVKDVLEPKLVIRDSCAPVHIQDPSAL